MNDNKMNEKETHISSRSNLQTRSAGTQAISSHSNLYCLTFLLFFVLNAILIILVFVFFFISFWFLSLHGLMSCQKNRDTKTNSKYKFVEHISFWVSQTHTHMRSVSASIQWKKRKHNKLSSSIYLLVSCANECERAQASSIFHFSLLE